MRRLGIEKEVVDPTVYANTIKRFREARIALPTFAQLADPLSISGAIQCAVETVDPDEASALNLFRVHWHNDKSRRRLTTVPEHVVLPKALTGVDARIVVALGDRFPMIRAHKVLAAFGCLVPRIITGQFDPTRQRAVWPSTGNYCRGGVAISRIMGCRGVAVLPEGMSRERYAWLEDWVVDRSDIIKTPGTESNVKEIYDKCHELACDEGNVIFNQFSEFGNYIAHYFATGAALHRVFSTMREKEPSLQLRAFVSATGSAGTIAAGDYLKEHLGSLTVAVEALECPTMLYNGFGQHNIQGIGDKHIPLIHNVMGTDAVLAISDRATDRLNVLFNTEIGRRYLARRHDVPSDIIDALPSLGLSSIANILGAIKTAKYYDMGPSDVIITVATDSAALYGSEQSASLSRYFDRGFDQTAAGEVFGEHLLGATTDHLLELTREEKERIFNLGYFTWVEQQGVSVDEFRARKEPSFWTGMRAIVGDWDHLIGDFNGRTGVLASFSRS